MKQQTWSTRTSTTTVYFLVGLILLTVSARAGNDLNGHWQGAFARQGAIQELAVDFLQNDSGWSATYDIPDLILYREPVRDLVVAGDSLSLHLFWGTYNCLIHGEVGEITGENPKWGPPVSLHVKREPDQSHIHIESVSIPSDSLMLAGSLLLPDGNPPFAAVVLIEGSSTGGRSLWTYRSFGDLLARNGIAALIYDKRGTGESEGNLDSASFEDLTRDAQHVVDFLANRDDIDTEAIGLFGISQGGWIAPLVATRSDHVSFVETLGGPAVSIWKQELQRVEYSMRAGSLGEDEPDSFTAEEVSAALAHTQLGFEVAQNPDRWNEWEASLRQARTQPWAKYVNLDSTLQELQEWLKFRYDPKSTLSRLHQPLLALFGEKDVLVPPAENVTLLEQYLAAGGNKVSQIDIFPDVGHDFLTGATLVGGDWKWPTAFWHWNRRAVGLADTIVVWTRQACGKTE